MFSMIQKILSRSVCKNNASGTGAFFQGRSGKRWLNGGWEALEPREYLAVDLISGPGIFPTNLANNESSSPSISANGRYVAFVSSASNLVANDTNFSSDIFVKDTTTGIVTRVNTNRSGMEAAEYSRSSSPSISADGRYVAFQSDASNLVPGDDNFQIDIFVKDITTGAISRVNTNSSGVEANNFSNAPSISANGRYVAFVSGAFNLVSGDTNFKPDIYVKDTVTGSIVRVSTRSSGAQFNNKSDSPSISADGKFVTFRSAVVSLGDTNSKPDIYVKDLTTGALKLVSSSSTGLPANLDSHKPSISANGRYIAFQSNATNLVAGDSNGQSDIFVKDTTTGSITRVSTSNLGTETNHMSSAPTISANGLRVSFLSYATNLVSGDTNQSKDVFVKNITTGAISRNSTSSTGLQSNADTIFATLSGDGMHVAFESRASNLTWRDINSNNDIFVKNISTQSVLNASTRQFATEGALNASYFTALSSNGRYVAFTSYSSNLVANDTNNAFDVFVKDSVTGTITRVNTSSVGTQANASYASSFSTTSISADGRYVAFESNASNLVPDDSNNDSDIFVKDTVTGNISRISTGSDGTQANSFSSDPSLSANGRYVAFESVASNLVPNDSNNRRDIFVKDTVTGNISRISTSSDGTQANSVSSAPSLSANGRYVAFESVASNLVPNDTNFINDIFFKDTVTGAISRVSTSSSETQANDRAEDPSISANGRYIVFESDATNLVPNDSNNRRDIFVKDTATGSISRVSTDSNESQANGYSYGSSISADGRYITFSSYASNLVLNDTNNTFDIFVKDTVTGSITRVSTSNSGAPANDHSFEPSISADGQYIAFESDASNLVTGDNNRVGDIFRTTNPLITTPAPVATSAALPRLPLVELPALTTPVANEKEDNIPISPDTTAIVPINPEEVDRYFTREE